MVVSLKPPFFVVTVYVSSHIFQVGFHNAQFTIIQSVLLSQVDICLQFYKLSQAFLIVKEAISFLDFLARINQSVWFVKHTLPRVVTYFSTVSSLLIEKMFLTA